MIFRDIRRVAKLALPALLIAALAACGGGGDDDQQDGPDYVQEFLGEWKLGTPGCYDGGDGIYYNVDTITIANASGSEQYRLYQTDNCTGTAVNFKISFAIQHEQSTFAGRSNVIKADLTITKLESWQDGQTPVQSTAGLGSFRKALVDVDGGRLYFGDEYSVEDGQYPTSFITNYYYVK